MKNYIRYIVFTFLFIIILFLGWKLFLCGEKVNFYRVNLEKKLKENKYFEIDQASAKIFYLDHDKKVELRKFNITDGYFFKLSGVKKVVIDPHMTGKTGFFYSLYFQSSNKNRIEFVFSIKRNNRVLQLSRIWKNKFSSTFTRLMNLKKNDRLILNFKGTGIVCFSKPLLYKVKEEKNRNYVFLIGVDTFRGDQLGKKINGISLTPNLDFFKKDSVSFSNCFAQSSWTLPSFMSLFTGLYEFNHQLRRGESLGLNKPFLIKELSEKFITANLNSGVYLDKIFGFSRGFDLFKSKASYYGSEGGKILFNDAIELLKQTKFPESFMFLHTYQTHSPYAPPFKFLYALNRKPLNTKLTSIASGLQKKRFVTVNEDLKNSHIELHNAEIMAFDSFFGDFIKKLKQMNIYNQSMIVFMSDHGEEFYDHKGWDHGHSLYDELIRVPLIIKFPHNKYKNIIIKKNVGVIDILPTVLKFYDIKYNKNTIDGIDLVSVIRGKTKRKYLYSSLSNCYFLEAIPPKIAVIFDHYKIIYNYKYSEKDLRFFSDFVLPPETDPIEIFNLNIDKEEKKNIVNLKNDLRKKIIPIINKIKVIIKKNMSNNKNKNKIKIDPDLLKQLKTLGYI